MDFVRLDRADTVVTATRSLSPDSEVERIAIRSAIPSGHKVATQAMAAGDPVRKYAQIIGYASCDILPGDHVHTHNVAFRNWTVWPPLCMARDAAWPILAMGLRLYSG